MSDVAPKPVEAPKKVSNTISALDMLDLEAYRLRVRTARRDESEEVIFNSSQAHAAILIEELFHSAKQRVGILCKDLNSTVYDQAEVISAAKDFLAREGAELSVFVQRTPQVQSAFVKEVIHSPDYEGRITFRTKFADHVKFNFVVADGTGFRYEEDRDVHNAMATFNGPNLASQMAGLISEYRSRPLSQAEA